MMLLLVVLTTMTAWAETVETYYVDAKGTRHDATATVLTGGGATELAEGTYVVNSDIEYTGTITLGGDVNLILCDDKTMTVTNSNDPAIYGVSKALHIYGQSQGTGALMATTDGSTNAIFISNDNGAGSMLGIHGGVVTASTSYAYGAGIGVDCASVADGIVINGGQVTASGGNCGINCSYGRFDILGGQVTATGGADFGGLGICCLDEKPGVLTLGYSKASDFISFSNLYFESGGLYNENHVKIADGKVMTDGTNIYDDQTPAATLKALRNVTLRPATYTVTFDSNGGSAVDAQTMLYGEKATEPAAPTMEGGTFLGWTLNGADYDFDSEVTDNITLVAKWSVTTYYVDADGTRHDNINAIALGGGETPDNYGDINLAAGTYYVGRDITYTNKLWLEGDVTLILKDGCTMTIASDEIGFDSSNDLTIYGQSLDPATAGTIIYDGTSYGIWVNNYNQHSGSVSIATNPSSGARGIAAFNVTLLGGVLTVSANSTSAHAIHAGTLIATGGQLDATVTGTSATAISVNDVTLGWTNADDYIHASSYDTDGTVRIASGQTMTDGTNIYDDQTPSATLAALTNATLRPVTYTVTFDINYDEGTNPEAQTVLLGEKATEPADPTREGYTFGGWKNGDADYDFSAAVTSNLYLIAEWTPITYTVQFDNNGGSGTMDAVVATYDQWTSIPNCTFTAPDGKAMKEYGWNTEADGSGDSFYGEYGDFRNLASEQDAVVTLYAQWGKDIALCTADVPDPIYHPYSFHGYFYDGTWNDNHGNIKVYDGKTLLTYGTDYQYTTMESLDNGSCEELGEH